MKIHGFHLIVVENFTGSAEPMEPVLNQHLIIQDYTHTWAPFFLGGGQFAHPRKFLEGGWVRMGAQTEKIKRGGLGCANRVRKGFLGRGRVRKGAHYGIFFLLLLPLFSRRLL